jgi:dUTP pyrophosphatase
MTGAPLTVELKILDPRLPGWGFPMRGSALAAGLDLFACIEAPIVLEPQMPARLISAGIALSIGSPEWCALVLPRSGLGHKKGLVLGNGVGVIDADYEGPCLISAWNRNREEVIVIAPGDRIAQLILTRVTQPQFLVVTEFSKKSSRSQAGFGSSGVSAACSDNRDERNS